MRMLLLALLALVACTALVSTDVDSSLRCTACPEAQVVRIIDGDTLDTSRGRVRLFGVDTPERGQRRATEATERLRELAGDTVRLENGPRLIGPFGRRLVYVYTVEGVSIDATLIAEGLATAWTRDGQHRERLVGLEREAQIGLKPNTAVEDCPIGRSVDFWASSSRRHAQYLVYLMCGDYPFDMMFHPTRPRDRWSSVDICRAKAKGWACKTELVNAKPRFSVA